MVKDAKCMPDNACIVHLELISHHAQESKGKLGLEKWQWVVIF